MSVISRVLVTPNRIEALLRLIAYDGGSSATDTLRDRLVVQSLASGGETNFNTGDVVAEARALGLIRVSDGKCELTVGDASRPALLRHFESVLLRPEAARDAGHEDFPFALAWMVTFDPLDPIPWSELGIRIEQETGRELDITNDLRAHQMHYWMRYLGFSREFELGAHHAFIPDPSVALRRHLDELFAGEGELKAAEFMRRWADLCPVIDGGEARREVEAWMRTTGHDHRIPGPDTISRSSSHALNHLDRTREIELSSGHADDLKLSLALPGRLSAISHVRRERQTA